MKILSKTLLLFFSLMATQVIAQNPLITSWDIDLGVDFEANIDEVDCSNN